MTDAEPAIGRAPATDTAYRYSRRWMRDTVRSLSDVEDLPNALRVIAAWAIALGAGAVALWANHWLVYLAAGLVIGSRLQQLAVLMHEACHNNLFSNRLWNDLVGDLFVSYPLGIGLNLYRASHMRHHRYTNTEEDYDYRFQCSDPDQQFPRTEFGMVLLILRSLVGLNAPRMIHFARVWLPAANMHNPSYLDINFTPQARLRYLVWVAVVTLLILASPAPLTVVLLYLVPLLIWSNVVNRIRSMAEHNGVSNVTELRGTRTVIPNCIDRFFVAPFNVSYHLEHHLFPGVPGPNLKRLHDVLMTDPHFRENAHITQGYAGVFKELTRDHAEAG